MKGRRTAAMLCVLLGHALVILALLNYRRPHDRPEPQAEMVFVTELNAPYVSPILDVFPEPRPERDRLTAPELPEGASADSSASADSAAITQPAYTDWPKEGKDAAARVLAREAETQRVAKMFAGPQGTWSSLTKRQQSEFNHFRWKPGVDGLERDENGNTIMRVSDGCTLVNFSMIACAIGKKPPAYGDLFKDMRKYFDEQRLPSTDEGNGTEPESKRPPKWSKPLPEKKIDDD